MQDNNSKWMLYGANGYTGKLIIEEAIKRGTKPIIAGRNEKQIKELAEKYDLEYKIFTLSTPKRIAKHLDGIKSLLLAAGPFSVTSEPTVEACLLSKTNYFDITGEINVFENCARKNKLAKEAEITVFPGIGFDVVPSDCLAKTLHEKLPSAKTLTLAINPNGKASKGTMKTSVENFPNGGLIRSNGKITKVPTAWKITSIPFKKKPMWAMTIPWGDVSTAYYSTGIPNIAAYMVFPENFMHLAKLSSPFTKILSWKPLQNFIKRQIENNVKGPSDEEREKTKTYLWGRAEDENGNYAEGNLETLEGYTLTAITGVDILLKSLDNKIPSGFVTPSLALGSNYINTIEGSKLEVV